MSRLEELANKAIKQADLPIILTSRGYTLKRRKSAGESYYFDNSCYMYISKGDTNQREDVWQYIDLTRSELDQFRGGNALEFLYSYEGMNWIEAIEYILDIDLKEFKGEKEYTYKRENKKEFASPTKIKQTPATKEYKYPSNNIITNDDLIYQYLCKERKLNKNIVKMLIDKKYVEVLERDDFGFSRLVFPYHENNKIVGHQIHDCWCSDEHYRYKCRTGNKKYRQPNGRTEVGFNIWTAPIKRIEKIIIFESIIDLISFLELHKEKCKNSILVSCNGTQFLNMVLNYYKKHFHDKEIIIALDNDDAGQGTIINNNANHFKILKSQLKDWNEDLKQLKAK